MLRRRWCQKKEFARAFSTAIQAMSLIGPEPSHSLSITGQSGVAGSRAGACPSSVQLRNPYIDPLNYIQVEMIRRSARFTGEGLPRRRTAIRDVIELTINGVSGGLKNTG